MATFSPLSCFFLLHCFLAASLANKNDLLISTKSGRVQGKLLPVLDGEVRVFLGIPYGKPPVGNLRFRPPQPARPWRGVKDATNYANSCIQLPDTQFPGFRGAEMWNPNTPLSEDCLYLNVWTPKLKAGQSPLPVMIWIYGGGFTAGTTSLDIYDGRYLTKSEDVIVVSMNYRLSAFGFLALANNPNVRGNAGLMDQRLAIQWVVDNIAAFGGDPSQITLFGESAGSISVSLHVLSPGSNVLFKRAVMESLVPTSPGAMLDLEESQKRAIKLGTLLECPTSDPAELETCLQKVSASQLAVAQFGVASDAAYPFVPVVDGVFLPDKPELMIGKVQPKEMLMGVNKNEGSYFMAYGLPGFDLGENFLDRQQFMDSLKQYIGLDSSAGALVSMMYVSITDSSPGKYRDALEQVIADTMVICPTKDFAWSIGQAGFKPFLYYFQHRSSTNPWPEWMGVMHGYEIEFVFGLPLNPSLGYTQQEVNMSKRIMKYWATFARTGNPGDQGHEWPLYYPWSKYVTLDTNPLEVWTGLRFTHCGFWSTLKFLAG